MTLKQFNHLCTERKRYNHPNVPEHAVPPCEYKQNNTNALTKSVIAFLQYQGCQSERVSVEGRVIDQRKMVKDVLGRNVTIGSVKRIPSSATKGSADISSTVKGRSVKWEIKFGKDRQSEAQKQYQAAVEASGGYYFIVRDFESFTECYFKLIESFL